MTYKIEKAILDSCRRIKVQLTPLEQMDRIEEWRADIQVFLWERLR